MPNIHKTLGYALVLATACALAMLLSFGVARRLIAPAGKTAADQAAIRTGAELRKYSNELLGLTAEYQNRGLGQEDGGSEDFDRWRRYDYLPRLNDLRQRLLRSGDGREVAGLRHAANGLATAAGSQTARALPPETVAQVLKAAGQAESRIGELNVNSFLKEPAHMPRFGLHR